ncbi:acyl-CoA dehydrogenase family protein [Streptomyces sp. NPDC051704]|uniref:acyl-CoA dehydrogenase family protein n=1 Tax=Streptomyces sp. NPDC051704 TaxID=3365671 RepID=UPI0037BCDA2B
MTLTPSPPVPDVEAAALSAAEHAPRADRDGRLPDAVVEALIGTGLLAHFVPRAFGGAAGRFADCLPALLRLAEADPSAGWCAAVMTSMSRMAACLPAAGQEAVWAHGPHVPIAGTLQPAGTATPTAGGWLLSGRWPYCSGVHHARWALLSAVPEGAPGPRFLLVPRSAWTTEPTWSGAVGLRGTGSDTLVLDSEVFVPEGRSFTRERLFTASDPRADGDCYRIPHEAVSGLFFALPLLGAARAALSAWTAAASRHPSAGSLRDGDAALATASGKIDAADLLLRRAARTCDEPDALTPLLSARCHRDHATAAGLLNEAVQTLFHSAGVSATSGAGPLSRLWRDASVAALHPALAVPPAARDYAARLLRRAE